MSACLTASIRRTAGRAERGGAAGSMSAPGPGEPVEPEEAGDADADAAEVGDSHSLSPQIRRGDDDDGREEAAAALACGARGRVCRENERGGLRALRSIPEEISCTDFYSFHLRQ